MAGGISGSSMRRGLEKYWGRRRRRRSSSSYQRLNGSDQLKRDTVKLGGARRRWRIKMAPKIKIPRISSPKKLVVWVRDAYVRMMVGLAKSKVMSTTATTGVDPAGGFVRGPPSKEYDDKMIIHMYNSLIMVTTAGTVGSTNTNTPRFSI